jgi:hypothetical protein
MVTCEVDDAEMAPSLPNQRLEMVGHHRWHVRQMSIIDGDMLDGRCGDGP